MNMHTTDVTLGQGRNPERVAYVISGVTGVPSRDSGPATSLARSAANAIVMTSVLAVFIAVMAASAYRWRAKATLIYRAGFAAGLAWSAIRRFSAQLIEGLRRHAS